MEALKRRESLEKRLSCQGSKIGDIPEIAICDPQRRRPRRLYGPDRVSRRPARVSGATSEASSDPNRRWHDGATGWPKWTTSWLRQLVSQVEEATSAAQKTGQGTGKGYPRDPINVL